VGNAINLWVNLDVFWGRIQPLVTIQFALVELGGAGDKVTVERTISRRVAVPRATPDALVRGYGRALGEILAELSLDLARVHGG